LSVNSKEGFVNLSASMKDPVITASVAKGSSRNSTKEVLLTIKLKALPKF
jgi:hypothetical protein